MSTITGKKDTKISGLLFSLIPSLAPLFNPFHIVVRVIVLKCKPDHVMYALI